MVKFKQPGITLNVRGFEPISEGNLTEELAKRVIDKHPNLAELFVFEEEKPKSNGKEKAA